MYANSYDKSIVEALTFLQFGDKMPVSMKELTSQYKKLCLVYHPDKNDGSEASTENFKLLQKHYLTIGEYLLNNQKVDTLAEAEEIKEFHQYNYDVKNQKCHVVLIENEMTEAWMNVLNKSYGVPENKKSPGFIYKVPFAINNKTFNITLTLYVKPKNDNKSKLHVQSVQWVNDAFMAQEMQGIYAMVQNDPAATGRAPTIGAMDAPGADSEPRAQRPEQQKKGDLKSRTKKGDLKSKGRETWNRCQEIISGIQCKFKYKHEGTHIKHMQTHNNASERDAVLNNKRNITAEEDSDEDEVNMTGIESSDGTDKAPEPEPSKTGATSFSFKILLLELKTNGRSYRVKLLTKTN